MSNKSFPILLGSFMLLVSTSLKSQLYQIDLLLNALAFPMYLIIFSLIVQALSAKQSRSHVLLDVSVVLYLLYSYIFSLFAMLLTLLVFLTVFFAHKTDKNERKTEVDIDNVNLLSHFKENKKLYKLNLLFSMCILYYIVFYELIQKQYIVVSTDFW